MLGGLTGDLEDGLTEGILDGFTDGFKIEGLAVGVGEPRKVGVKVLREGICEGAAQVGRADFVILFVGTVEDFGDGTLTGALVEAIDGDCTTFVGSKEGGTLGVSNFFVGSRVGAILGAFVGEIVGRRVVDFAVGAILGLLLPLSMAPSII